MAYLGRHGASAPLNSADIPDNSITASKIVDGAVGVADIGENAIGASELDIANITGVLPVGVTGGSGLSAIPSSGLPSGSVLQVKGTNSNGAWGPISHGNEFLLPNQNVTITTKGLNSNYFISGRFNATNTANTTFGIGIGFRYLIGSTETNIVTAHMHENYHAATNNMYKVAHQQNYFSITAAIGTSITFRSYGRVNDSNATNALQTGLGQQTTIMEIKS